MNMKQNLRKFLIRNERLCENLNRSQKFYYWGVVLAALAGFWWLTPFNEIFIAALFTAGFLLTCAVISDILSIYKKIWETNIGKGFILVLYAAATNLAYALSVQFVNEIIRYESAQLTYTTNFVAVMLIPLFVVAATFIVFFILFLFGQFYVLLAALAEQLKPIRCLRGVVPSNIEKYPFRTFFVRLIAFPSVLGFYQGIAGNALPSYIEFMESSTKSFIYQLEAKKYSRCILKNGERAISISEKEVVIAKKHKNGYDFEPQLCLPRLKPNKKLNKDAAKSAAPVS
jgi:hypothetical protein